jgi:hypothetical protein
MSDFYRLNVAFFIKIHIINTSYPVVGVCLAQGPAMIYNIPGIFARNLHHRMVPGTGGYSRVLLKYFIYPLEWPER